MIGYQTETNFEVAPQGEEQPRWASPWSAARAALRMSGEDLPVAEAWVDKAGALVAAVTDENIASQAVLLTGSFAERHEAAIALAAARADADRATLHLADVSHDIAAAQVAAADAYSKIGSIALTSLSYPVGAFERR